MTLGLSETGPSTRFWMHTSDGDAISGRLDSPTAWVSELPLYQQNVTKYAWILVRK